MRQKILGIVKAPISLLMRVFPAPFFGLLRFQYIKMAKQLAREGKPLIIFQRKYGGLGDHLVYSALPSALKEKYGLEVRISNQSAFRSSEVKHFVWNGVPFSDEQGVAIRRPPYKKYKNYNTILLALFGITGHPLFSPAYSPKQRDDVKDKIICDLTFGPSGERSGFSEPSFRTAVLKYLLQYDPQDLIFLEPAGYGDQSLLTFVREKIPAPLLPVKNLEELCDVICSAKERIFLDSGAKSLAALYGKLSIVLEVGRGDPFFRYDTNTHHLIGS
jgi:hypothetical protein